METRTADARRTKKPSYSRDPGRSPMPHWRSVKGLGNLARHFRRRNKNYGHAAAGGVGEELIAEGRARLVPNIARKQLLGRDELIPPFKAPAAGLLPTISFSHLSQVDRPRAVMSRTKALWCGLLAGLIGAIGMIFMMLVLATLGVATPLTIIGDRLSVFFRPGPFLALMGKVGGYNHLKQLGVGSTVAGLLLVGALGGAFLGLFNRREDRRLSTTMTIIIFILLPIVGVAVALWPVLGTNYRGLPINAAGMVTL